MSEVKTYAVNCNDAWLNTDGDDISDSYVKYADYLELAVQLANAESKCRELATENEKWQQESQSWQAVAEKQLIAVGELEKHVSELASRQVDLPTFNIPVRWGTVMICVDMTEIKKRCVDAIRAAGIGVKGE